MVDELIGLDIQLALNTVYDAFNYGLSLDYTRPPEIPLTPQDAQWVAAQLRQAGIVTSM